MEGAIKMTTLTRTFIKPLSLVVSLAATDIDQVGYATISNTGSLLAFTGATVPALASATYDLDVTVDSTLRQVAVALLNTDDWDGIAAKIQVALRALTSSTETVAIVSGKIKITSATNGSTSTILIAAGTAGSPGGDLLAAIDALGATYVTSLDTPVDGVEGTISIPVVSGASATNPTRSFEITSISVKTSAGKHKYGFHETYSTTTGLLTVFEVAGETPEFETGDIVAITGVFYT